MSEAFERILAVMVKEFIQLTRDRLTYAMILALPIVQLLLFGYAINDNPKHLPTVALIQDDGRYARSVVSALKSSAYFRLVSVARTPAEVDQLIGSGRVQFALVIPHDFSRRVMRGDGAQILVEADATDPAATGPALAALAALPQTALADDLPHAGPTSSAAPFEVVVHKRYNPEDVTAFNIVPGLLGVILSLTLVLMTALAVTRERERGTMESLLATPVRPLEVMIGKLGPYVLVGLVQAVLILALARLLFAVPMAGGWAGLGLGLLLFIVGSLALGFLISTLARTQLQAMQMSFFYIMPSLLISGFMFPFAGMPAWARALGSALPVTHFLRIVRGSLLKGESLLDSAPSLAALAAFVVTVTTLAVARYDTRLD